MEKGHDNEIVQVALRPIFTPGRFYWSLFIGLAVLAGLGVLAYAYQLKNGLGVTGLNDDVFWGFYETDLVTFIGISYGGAVVSAILRLTHSSWRAPITRLAEGMALVSLPVGALFPLIHLGHPERLWQFLVTPNPTSPVVWDLVAIMTYLVATVIFFYLPLIPDLAASREFVKGARRTLYSALAMGWRGLPEQHKRLNFGLTVMAVLIIPLAVSVHSVLAFIFSMTSRPGWHSTIFGPYFVIAALFSGVAAVILVIASFRKAYHLEKFITEKQFRYLGFIMLTLGMIYLYFTFTEFLTEGYVLAEGSLPLMESLLITNYAALFWTFVIFGAFIPIMLVVIPRTRNVNGIVVASAFILAGMWLKRFLIVVPPLREALIPGATAVYNGSLVEGAITLGAAAAIPLLLMIIFRIFPVLSISEIEEVTPKVAHKLEDWRRVAPYEVVEK